LYGAAGALVGLSVGLGAAALGWATDLGPLWKRAFEDDEEPRGARLVGYLVAGALALGVLGVAVRMLTVDALHRFHHRLLIAALVGGDAAAIALVLVPLVFLLASALSGILPVGPRVRLGLRAPAGLYAGGWALGLGLGAAAITLLVSSLQL